MKIHPGNAQDIGARKEQQDAFSFSNPEDHEFIAHGGLLAVLADGMGGMGNGGHASSIAVRSFLREYESKTAKESIPNALRRSLAASCRDVAVFNARYNIESGSTLIGASVSTDRLYWISVGDSHIYLLRDGELIQLNRDHTFGQTLLDAAARGEIPLNEVGAQPDREHLTSYLGMRNLPEEVDANSTSFPLREGDQVVICSDGVYRMLGTKEFIEALDDPSPSSACERVRQLVLSRQHPNQDNLTMLVLRCGEQPRSAGSEHRRRWMTPVLLLLVALNLAFGLDTFHGWRTLHEPKSSAVYKNLTDKDVGAGANPAPTAGTAEPRKHNPARPDPGPPRGKAPAPAHKVTGPILPAKPSPGVRAASQVSPSQAGAPPLKTQSGAAATPSGKADSAAKPPAGKDAGGQAPQGQSGADGSGRQPASQPGKSQ